MVLNKKLKIKRRKDRSKVNLKKEAVRCWNDYNWNVIVIIVIGLPEEEKSGQGRTTCNATHVCLYECVVAVAVPNLLR